MEIRYRMLDVGYIQLGGSPMMVGKPIHEISSCGGRCLLRFAKTYICHGKVSIGGIDDMLFEEGRSASGVSEKAPHYLGILRLMPDFADNPCVSQQSLHAHTHCRCWDIPSIGF